MRLIVWVGFVSAPFQRRIWGSFVPHSWGRVEWNSIPPWLGCSGRATIHTAQGGWAPIKRSHGGLAEISKMNWLALFGSWPPDTRPCILQCCPHGTFLLERSPHSPEFELLKHQAGKWGFKEGKLRPAKMCQHTSTLDSVGHRLPAGSNCCQSGRPTKSEPPEGKIVPVGNSGKIWGTFCITDIMDGTVSAPPCLTIPRKANEVSWYQFCTPYVHIIANSKVKQKTVHVQK